MIDLSSLTLEEQRVANSAVIAVRYAKIRELTNGSDCFQVYAPRKQGSAGQRGSVVDLTSVGFLSEELALEAASMIDDKGGDDNATSCRARKQTVYLTVDEWLVSDMAVESVRLTPEARQRQAVLLSKLQHPSHKMPRLDEGVG